jgi:ABC-type multidrug transport system fused ATPase/permease subunit
MRVREAVREALSLLSLRDRRLLGLAIIVQMSTSLLDLLGVLLMGLVGALAVTTIQSQPPPATVSSIVDRLGLGSLSDQQIVAVLAIAAAATLLLKSAISSVLTRRVFIFLANRQALVSARLARALLSSSLIFVQRRSSQETSYALIQGAGAATVQILGQLVIAATELALLLVLAIGLLFVDPVVTLGAVAYFTLLAVILQRSMGRWANRIGSRTAEVDIASLNAVQEAMAAYREVTVTDRRDLYVDRIQDLRWQAAKFGADLTFIGLIPKYVFEVALVIGGFILAATLFSVQGSAAAVGVLVVFLAAGSRVMPSLLRLQGAALGLRSASGAALPTFQLSTDLRRPIQTHTRSAAILAAQQRIRSGHDGFVPDVVIHDVSVTYPGAALPALQSVSLSIPAGSSLALVGRSGSGKSTLADVILGVLRPDTGEVWIGNYTPEAAIRSWPGGIAYVPQTVVLADDSIRSNVALGLPRDFIDDDLVWEALHRAHLADFLKDERAGLDTRVGEGGVRLSGGQRQRLGVARALYTRPLLLVLDEATSALDAQTEEAISSTIRELESEVSTIIIAHRLSTVRHVQQVAYLDRGCVAATGRFDEVLALVPEMARQAHLMGLSHGGN